MKDFLSSLLPKNFIFNPKKNKDLDISLDIISLGLSLDSRNELQKIKQAFLAKLIDPSLFPEFEREYGLPGFFNYTEINNNEKENIIKAKIFIAKNGIKTLDDYKFLAQIFDIRDINIQTYVEYIENRYLDFNFDGFLFGEPLNANFLLIISLPKELKQTEEAGTLDIELDFEFADLVPTNLDNFKKLLREIIPITHDIEYEYIL